MISEYEAAKLRREMQNELDGAHNVVLKCAVGIVVLVTLAIVSPTLGLERGAPAEAVSASAAAE